MSHRFFSAAAVCGLLVFSAVPARAHHSVSAEFDYAKPIAFQGVVVKLMIVNPHSVLHVERTNADGSKTVWLLQTLSAGQLRQRGLAKSSAEGGIKPGQTVTVEGIAARSGNAAGFLTKLTMPDGRLVTTYFGDPNGN